MLRSRKSCVCWIAAAAVLLCALGLASAQAQAPASIFEKKCYSCHNIGGGDKRGPDLKGVPSQQPREWFREFIKSPAAMNRKGDPAAGSLFKKFAPEIMPDQDLSDDQIDALVAFVDDLSRKGQQFVPAGARLGRSVVAGDAERGLDLFLGRTPLRGGGTACISCHNLKDAGALGGGTLGPDLTAVSVKYRDPELISILQNPNFPTMASVFGSHPLGDEEIVQIFALFQSSKAANPNAPVQTAGGPAQMDPRFLFIGCAALVAVLLVSDRIWRNRFQGVREQLVRRRKS